MRIIRYELDDKVHINEGAEIIDVVWEAGIEDYAPGTLYLVVLEEDTAFSELHNFNVVLTANNEEVTGKYIGKAFDGEQWHYVFETEE